MARSELELRSAAALSHVFIDDDDDDDPFDRPLRKQVADQHAQLEERRGSGENFQDDVRLCSPDGVSDFLYSCGLQEHARRFRAERVGGHMIDQVAADDEVLDFLGVYLACDKARLRLALARSGATGEVSHSSGVTSIDAAGQFLASCGLQQHAERFREERIDGLMLDKVAADDEVLEFLGVETAADKARLRAALAEAAL